MPSPSSPWASVTTAGAAGPAASQTERALCCSRSPAANLDMAGRHPTAQSKTGLTGSWQLARFRGSLWPCFSPSDLPLHALDTFTNAALLSLGGIEKVSLMPHLDAGELAARATALRWQRGREAGTHGCWQRNGPSVALTCVCTLGCLVASLCLSPALAPPWSQRCCLDAALHPRGCGARAKGSAAGWAAQEQGGSAPARSSPQLPRRLAGLCARNGCRRESISEGVLRPWPPSATGTCLSGGMWVAPVSGSCTQCPRRPRARAAGRARVPVSSPLYTQVGSPVEKLVGNNGETRGVSSFGVSTHRASRGTACWAVTWGPPGPPPRGQLAEALAPAAATTATHRLHPRAVAPPAGNSAPNPLARLLSVVDS